MKTPFPNTQNLLPSQARALLTDFFLTRLKTSKLNYLADPTYRSTDARDDIERAGHEIGSFTWKLSEEAFKNAQTIFEHDHPCYLEGNKMFRVGLDKPPSYGV